MTRSVIRFFAVHFLMASHEYGSDELLSRMSKNRDRMPTMQPSKFCVVVLDNFPSEVCSGGILQDKDFSWQMKGFIAVRIF